MGVKGKILLVFGSIFLIIISVIIQRYNDLINDGDVVLLNVSGVDPKDFFRGTYIAMRYDLSIIPNDITQRDTQHKKGDRVFVTLEIVDTSNNIAKMSQVVTERPISGLYIRAIISHLDNNRVYLEFGIEHFFIQEKTQDRYRDLSKYFAQVAIDKKGVAVLKDLVLKD